MDNSFYDEAREERIRTRKNQEQNKSFMSRVVATQLVASLLIAGLLFLICRSDTGISKNIKDFYGDICKKDIAVSTILDVVKNTAKSVFAPSVQDDTTETTESTTAYEA